MGYVKEFKKVEVEFGNIISKYGEVVYANAEQDMFEHWDLKIINEHKEVKFDVKAMKKTNRSDSNVNDQIHWVELQNVRGNKGWLYGGADYFAFEMQDKWLLVKKKRLQTLIEEKCDQSNVLTRPELYKLYQRQGRQDLITLIKTEDLINISDRTLKK